MPSDAICVGQNAAVVEYQQGSQMCKSIQFDRDKHVYHDDDDDNDCDDYDNYGDDDYDYCTYQIISWLYSEWFSKPINN